MVVEDTWLGFAEQRRKGHEGMVEIPVRIGAGAADVFRSVDHLENLEELLGAVGFFGGLGREKDMFADVVAREALELRSFVERMIIKCSIQRAQFVLCAVQVRRAITWLAAVKAEAAAVGCRVLGLWG